jgi:RHS repeat-associated protein
MTNATSTIYFDNIRFTNTTASSTTYTYDHQNSRVTKRTNATTTYPNQFYELFGATSTKHLYANGELIASIEGTSVYTIHNDHLGGTNVVSNASGTLTQLLSYYPFGAQRINEQETSFAESNTYIGQEFDDSTGLYYLNARYYEGSRGQFLSQDPVFWQLSSDLLSDPQQMNSYSYARNNPVTLKDPTGLKVELKSKKTESLKSGIHTWVEISANKGSDLSHLGFKDQTRITLGGYNKGGAISGNLVKEMNSNFDFNDPNGNHLGGIEVARPDQFDTQEAFEQSILNTFNELSTDQGAYSLFTAGGQANSNNFASHLLLQNGVTSDQIQQIQSTFPTANVFNQTFQTSFAPGLGTGLPTNPKKSFDDRWRSFTNYLNSF